MSTTLPNDNIHCLITKRDHCPLVGTAICCFAASAPIFVIGRALVGLATASGIPICIGILTEITTARERPMFFAIILSMDVVALSGGAMLGGLFDTRLDYRLILALPAAWQLIAMMLIMFPYKPPKRQTGKKSLLEHMMEYDFVGFALLLTSMALSLVGPQLAAQANDRRSPGVVISLSLSVFLFLLFITQQYLQSDTDRRFLPRGLLPRNAVVALGIGGFTIFGMYLTEAYLATWFEVKANHIFESSPSTKL